MSNQLTGAFDAVVEVRAEAVNRILATLHQNGAFEEKSPKFLHSFTARVGDASSSKFELAEAFLVQALGDGIKKVGNVDVNVLANLETHILGLHDSLVTVARNLSGGEEAASDLAFEELVDNLPWLINTRGLAKVQISTLTISIPEGSTSEITVHCRMRAVYTPDPGTAALPDNLHGEVKVNFAVQHKAPSGDNPAVLEVSVAEDKQKVLFVPEPGTNISAAEAKRVSREIWRFARTKFDAMEVELAEGFPFRNFKGLGTGSNQAIALPLLITGHVPALTQPMDTVTDVFLGFTDDFAAAISKEYIDLLIDDQLQLLRDFNKTFGASVTVIPPPPAPPLPVEVEGSVHVWVSTAETDWQPGKIILKVKGHLTISSNVADEEHHIFTIAQDVTLKLNPDGTTVSLKTVGAPQIDGLPADIEQTVVEKIGEYAGSSVDEAENQIQAQFTTMRSRIDEGVQTFDSNAQSAFTSLDVTAHGIILHGSLTVSERLDPFVEMKELPDGAALTAFKSWIPAGSINRYVWTWVSPPTADMQVPFWSGVEHEVTEEHRFIFRPNLGDGQQGPEKSAPAVPPWQMYSICLRVEGTQIGDKSGVIAEVAGGSTCQVEQPDWLVATAPPWLDAVLLVPVWGPDPGPEGILDQAIQAHVNAAAARPARDARTNAVIHFAGTDSIAPLSVLSGAWLASKRGDTALSLIVVLPRGSFRQTRTAIDRALGVLSPEARVPVAITEDYEGGWTAAFGVSQTPATYLMNATGEVVWHHLGRLDAGALTFALDTAVTSGRRIRPRLQRLGVRTGAPAPDFVFDEHPNRRQLSLHSLTGRPVLLNFWRSASTPSRSELGRLLRTSGHVVSHERTPRILAIGDGEDEQTVAAMAREQHQNLTVIPDPNREIARLYGVNCWPTTVVIDRDGLVQGVRFGSAHRHIHRR